MVKDKPFIHLFKTPYNYYIFDVNTNSIMDTTKEVYEALYKEQKKIPINTDDEDTLKKIDSLKDKGFLSSNKPKEIVHTHSKYLDYYLEHKVKKLTLQITQKCNFRCSYCVYSEADNELQRTHSNKKMSIETAKKAIEFLVEHSSDEERINIGFYGGEPLLEFDLIKECIHYSKEIGEGKEVTFTITTNGSLLSEEIIEFFIKHDVSTMISLDGPENIHDRHRRFAANGCGTFKAVEERLEMITTKYPEYLDKISFNIVVNPQDDFKCVNTFFMDYEFFKKTTVRSSLIDDVYSDEKITFTDDYLIKNNYEVFKMFLHHLGKLDRDKVSPIALQELGQIKDLGRDLGHSVKLPESMSHSGPCIPGQLRLFVSAEGDFYPCERVSETSEVMKIGNIEDGFYIEKARKLLNVGQTTANKCKNCWAINHCTLCAKYADDGDKLSGSKKSEYCRSVKDGTENSMKNLVALKELKKVANI